MLVSDPLVTSWQSFFLNFAEIAFTNYEIGGAI
jgi:hypothetical protein